MKPDSETDKITKGNAARFVADAPADELANWNPCPYEGCVYCTEVKRLKEEKAKAAES